MATEYLTNDIELTSVADAIRAKSGQTGQLIYPDGFVSAIQAIPQKTTLLASNIAIDDGVLTFSVDRQYYIDGYCNFMVIERVDLPIYKLVLWENSNSIDAYYSISHLSSGYSLGTNYVTITSTTDSVYFRVNTGDSGGAFYTERVNVYGWLN